jgi:hypothetical protein
MSPLIALLILGSVATSASAAAVDEVLSPLSHQQQSTPSHPPNSGPSQRRRARGRVFRPRRCRLQSLVRN